MSKLSNQAYAEMSKKASPPSRSLRNLLLAFLIGGAICTLGEALINVYLYLGLSEEVASPLCSITLVLIAVLLTGFNLYDDVARFGGAGTLVPITGFANAVASPALEFKSEGYILGLGAKMFIIAGPVLVYGLSAGIIYGLILFLFKLY